MYQKSPFSVPAEAGLLFYVRPNAFKGLLTFSVRAVVAVVALLWTTAGCKKNESPDSLSGAGPYHLTQACQDENSGTRSVPSTDLVAETVKGLVRQGWTEKSARVVAEFNQRFLEIAWETDRAQWEKVIALWGRLGTRERLLRLVERMPEFASLLAGALEVRSDAADLIAESIPDELQARELVTNLYGIYAEASDSVLLAEALRRDGDLIRRLWAQGSPQALPWVLKASVKDGTAQAYRQWIRQVLEEALDRAGRGEEESMDLALTLLDIHAPVLFQMLQDDESFRQRFLGTYWPVFRTALDNVAAAQDPDERKIAWISYVWDPRVWTYYHLLSDKGEEAYWVFERYGPVAVDLMLTPEYREVRDKVFNVLQNADQEVLEGLADPNLRSQPLFQQLLRRELPGWAIAIAVRKLRVKSAETPRLLSKWADLSDSALLEDLGPRPEGLTTWLPGYAVYYLFRKRLQGRDVDTLDYFSAAIDAAAILIPITKGSSLGSRLVQRAVPKGASRLAVSGTEQAVRRAGTRAVAPLAITDAHYAGRQVLRNAAAGVGPQSFAVADITQLTRWLFHPFRGVGLGRKTFKALTGLEARVFMRADRRVAIDGAKMFSENTVFRIALNETLENAGFDLVLRLPGRQELIEKVSQSPELAAKQNHAWKQHLSVWWTAIHTGSLEDALQDVEQANSGKPNP